MLTAKARVSGCVEDSKTLEKTSRRQKLIQALPGRLFHDVFTSLSRSFSVDHSEDDDDKFEHDIPIPHNTLVHSVHDIRLAVGDMISRDSRTLLQGSHAL